MLSWMGYDLADLKRSAETIDGIPVMGLKHLIDCKTRMGRKKDLADLKLIHEYQQAPHPA